MTDTSPKRRRWFQFRLRTLLIAVLVLSLPLSWFGVKLEKARKQREAVRAIQHAGGTVMYYGRQPERTAFWTNLIGHDFFHEVCLVDCSSVDITEQMVIHIASFTSLEWLWLCDSTIDDEGLKHLGSIATVGLLLLESDCITDDGLVYLEGLINLGYLHVEGKQVTDRGIDKLQNALPDCSIVFDNGETSERIKRMMLDATQPPSR